ncbi:hypothetical protein [Bradyrhizobium shewense]|uniref:hypothetical protein n=1 Tax=Bradyrhizobium shewense TaxID=1761772 RepID=UPI001ABF9D41
MFVLAGVQRVEIGNAIDAEHHGFAVDNELLLPADSEDLARVYRFDLAQDSEMISPTIPI